MFSFRALLHNLVLCREQLQWEARLFLLRRTPEQKLVTSEYAKALSLALFYVRSADVEGDVAEFGSHGVTATVIAKQLQRALDRRTLHLFDTFSGFPAPDASELQTPHIQSMAWREGSSRGPSADAVERKLLRCISKDRLRLHVGLFEDTLPNFSSSISMLVMDSCFYSSTFFALDHCFSQRLVSEGAIILFSDWNANLASPQFGSRKAWDELVTKYKIKFSSDGHFCWGGTKFIVHKYTSDLKPFIGIKGTSAGWITRAGVIVEVAASALRIRPTIVLRGNADYDVLGGEPRVKASLVGGGMSQAGRELPAKLVRQSHRYEITIDGSSVGSSSDIPVTIQLDFDRCFVPKDLGISADARELVIQTPSERELRSQ